MPLSAWSVGYEWNGVRVAAFFSVRRVPAYYSNKYDGGGQ